MYFLYIPCFLSVNFQWGLAEVEQEEQGLTELGLTWVLFLQRAPGCMAELGDDVQSFHCVLGSTASGACPMVCLLPSELGLAISRLMRRQQLASYSCQQPSLALCGQFIFVSRVRSSVPGICGSLVNICEW